jgi:hypothetical protein
MKDTTAAMHVFEAIHQALGQNDKTREPMNALVVWTELGRGLSGKLERQGADRGILGRLIDGYCRAEGGGAPIDLGRWAYRVEPAQRLSSAEAGAAIGRAQRAIEERLCSEWGDGGGEERQMEYFMATVRGWFPVGLDIVRSLPAFRGAGDAEVYAALGAWCARYLPRDTSGPSELGIRMERGGA